MSKIKRKCCIASAILCSLIIGSSVSVYAATKVYTNEYSVNKSAVVAVLARYTSRIGKDEGFYNIAMRGKQADKVGYVVEYSVYARYVDGKSYCYDCFVEHRYVDDTITSANGTYRFKDAESFRVKTFLPDGTKKYLVSHK